MIKSSRISNHLFYKFQKWIANLAGTFTDGSSNDADSGSSGVTVNHTAIHTVNRAMVNTFNHQSAIKANKSNDRQIHCADRHLTKILNVPIKEI